MTAKPDDAGHHRAPVCRPPFPSTYIYEQPGRHKGFHHGCSRDVTDHKQMWPDAVYPEAYSRGQEE